TSMSHPSIQHSRSMPSPEPKTRKTAQPETKEQEEQIPASRCYLHVPAVTFIKIGFWILLGYGVYRLWSLILLLLLACLLAITLNSGVSWLSSKGIKRKYGLWLVIGFTVGLIALTVAMIIPALVGQAQNFGNSLPSLQKSVLSRLGGGW